MVNATINKYSFATLRISNGRSARIESFDLNESLECSSDSDLKFDGTLDLAKAVIRHVGSDITSRYRAWLLLHTDAPPGSGLGSSSAAVVAMLGSFREWLQLPWTKDELAMNACQIEREDLRIPGGYQDQYASVFGGFNMIEFGSTVRVQPLRLSQDFIDELNRSLVLCFTGSAANHLGIIEDQVHRLVKGVPQVKGALDRTKELALEMRSALVRGDIQEIGRLLDQAWQVKKRFSKSITNSMIDRLYDGARRAGALGGKVTGAGGGGHMVLCCKPERRHELVRFLTSHRIAVVDFSFQAEGLQSWRVS